MFRLVSLLLLVGSAAGVGVSNSTPSIAEKLAQIPELSSLYNTVLEYPPLVKLFSNGTDLTLFAPNNAAFAAIKNASLPSDLSPILSYHGLPVVVLASNITEKPAFLLTLLSDPAYVNKGEAQALKAVKGDGVMINDATVVTADIVCSNGVIHIIDTVLLPPKATSKLIQENGLTSLMSALNSSDLTSFIDNTAALTIFAPTDDAFDKVANTTMPTSLSDTLKRHVVQAIAYSTDLYDGMQIPTVLEGVNLTVTTGSDGVFINNAKVELANVLTKNAVVHVMGDVILLDVVSTLSQFDQLTALTNALKQYPEIVKALQASGGFTLFAPTNTALGPAAVPEDILLYHALSSVVMASDITATPAFPETFLTNGSFVNKGGEGQAVTAVRVGKEVKINDAKVSTADILCWGGVIHIVDAVLVPPKKTSEVAKDAGLTGLLGALKAVNLTETIDDTAKLTIFAPTDKAFDVFLANRTGLDLTDLLKYHVLGDQLVYSTDMNDGEQYETLEGKDIKVNFVNGTVVINDRANVLVANVLTENAVVHVIDQVLEPAYAPPKKPKKISTGAVIGIVIGSLVVLGAAIWCCRRNKQRADTYQRM